MRPFGVWFGRLAMSGACLLGAGCGGGESIPDPDSDSRAARADVPSKPVSRGGDTAQDASSDSSPKPDPTALASNTPSPEAGAPGPKLKGEPATKPEEKPTDTEKTPPPTKGDSSGTEEMLKGVGAGVTPPASGQPATGGTTPGAPGAGTTPGPGSTPVASTPPVPGGGVSSPGVPPFPGARPGELDGPARGGGAGAPGGPSGMSKPGAAGNDGAPGAPSAPGSPGASGFGASPGPGGPPGSDAASTGASAFNRPSTAVQAFLAALKAKDKVRLKESVARRAKVEAVEKHRKIFAAIDDESLSDDELDEMSKAFDGFQVASQLTPESSKRIGIVVGKMVGRDYQQRTIMTRQEKEGWKVLDIEKLIEYRSSGSTRKKR